MTLSIIISYYKNTKSLKAILNALLYQSDNDFEVIISEDDNANETIELINEFSEKLNIKHIFHEDKGFRKNIVLNKSIIASSNEVLVFIDGDCIPNKQFVFQYKKNISQGTFLIGRRVMLFKKISDKILNSDKYFKINVFKMLFYGAKVIEHGIYLPFLKQKESKRGLCGCNWAVYKSDILDINGFDEDYLNPGVGEDVDIEWRLLSNGCKHKSIRNKAFVYHLFHERGYSQDVVNDNYKKLENKKQENNIFCKNGIIKS